EQTLLAEYDLELSVEAAGARAAAKGVTAVEVSPVSPGFLAAKSTLNNWRDTASIPGLHEDNLPRDAGLQIRLLPSRDRYWLMPQGQLFDPSRGWLGEVLLRPEDVFQHVENCRR